MTVRTRFAPSPTGVLHIGSIRTALFCWLYARHHGGEFLVRIEDTDRERSTPENVEAIFDGLGWLQLESDEKPIFQSERSERYRSIIDEWLENGTAYYCYATREELDELREKQRAAGEHVRYDGRWRDRDGPREGVDPVVRFRNPDTGTVVVNDAVRGKVVFENAQLDDLIIARSDGSPTYNFTVIVDDTDMNISHVIRGDDHLNNTPRQINMIRALGKPLPVYAHLPMILGEDGAKLSKRHGAVDIRDYRRAGYLREALLNYLVRLGWSHGDQEVFSLEEMIGLFDIADINQSASAFNPEKLRWLNQQYVINADSAELGETLRPFLLGAGYDLSNGPSPADIASTFRERAVTLQEMAEAAWYCFRDIDEIDAKAAKKHLRPVILEPLKVAVAQLDALDEWTVEGIGAAVAQVAERFEINLGKLGQPMRVAITGGPVSPPIDQTAWVIGRERVLARLALAIELIEARAAAQ